jgi:hypothetical protein
MRKPIITAGAITAIWLTGCAKEQPTPIPIATDKLCQSWQHKTIKKADKLTDETASKIEGDNKARVEWQCEFGENRAKS